MGAAVGRQAILAARVLWLPDGRSTATADRATAAGLRPARDLPELVRDVDIVISLCPPQFADPVATEVLAAGFHRGLFVEANAITPERMASIGEAFTDAGVRLVDGSLIGPPPAEPGTTRLYLAGAPEDTATVVNLFAGSALEAVPISTRLGAASALKTAQAVFQKASRALAGLAHALANHYGVADALTEEGQRRSRPILAEPDDLPSVAARAWRWSPELAEAAATLRTAGLPDTMIRGAKEILDAWAPHRDAPPDHVDVLYDRLQTQNDTPPE